jgi:hypothetical protein
MGKNEKSHIPSTSPRTLMEPPSDCSTFIFSHLLSISFQSHCLTPGYPGNYCRRTRRNYRRITLTLDVKYDAFSEAKGSKRQAFWEYPLMAISIF